MRNFLPSLFTVVLTVVAVVAGNAQNGIFFTDCTDKTYCFGFNQCGSTNLELTTETTTNCGNGSVTLNYKIDFGNNGSIEIQANGDTITESFPPGQSKITWRATNGCGQAATCTQVITVKDCQPPNLLCRNGVTQSLDNNCMLTINAQQYVLSISDNCTPTANLIYGLRRAGTGTGFPPYDTINYSKCDQGTNIVEVFVKDAAGNINQCANYVLVQNNSGLCPCIEESKINMAGCARTVNNKKLNNYRIKAQLTGTAAGQPVSKQKTLNVTDSCYTIFLDDLPINLNANVVITGSRTGDMTIGVTPYDLVLISRHILNFEPFTSFYQTLAADVNRSQTVTTFDIVEIRKTLLGSVDTLPAVGSWQFIRPVPDTTNLIAFADLKDTFKLTYTNLTGETSASGFNFLGIKSADIDRTANFTGDELEERNGIPIVFTTTDRWVNAGETVEIPVRIAADADLTAWQANFMIQPEHAVFESLEGISPENYVPRSDGEIRMLWMDENLGASKRFEKEDIIFTLKIKVLQAAQLSNIISAKAVEAVSADVARHPLVFRFTENANDISGDNQIFAPAPNPFTDHVEWPLSASGATAARLTVCDASGRVLIDQHFNVAEGYQTLTPGIAQFPAGGWYFWRLSLGETVQSGKLFRQ